MAQKTIKTYCRFCHAYCPMEATVEDNRLIALAPDPSNEIYGGYTCIKGRQLIEQIDHPTPLQQSQKKQPDGSFTSIGTEQAMDEIALQLDISERTWMEVTIDGDVVFSGWARGDDPPFEWTAQEEAKVNTGNGAGIFVTINEQPWGRMGERGENKEEVWRTTN